MSRNVVFDKLESWYSLPSRTLEDSIPITEDESSEAVVILEEEEIDTLEKSLISFRLSGPNEEQIDMPMRGEDLVVPAVEAKETAYLQREREEEDAVAWKPSRHVRSEQIQ